MKFRNYISRALTNLSGWTSNRKIIVIESDDWGSIRMPSKTVYEKCLTAGYRVDANPYERYDSLESEEDLEILFEVLRSYKNNKGNHPIITANCVVANPDFEKIRSSFFSNYYFETVIETFKKYPKHHNCFELWNVGNNEGLFHPQFHGREHLNVSLFMDALQTKDADVLFGFDNYMPGCISKDPKRKGNYYVEATYYKSEIDKEEKINFFVEGLQIFEKLLGYQSKSIIPPNYTWCRDWDKAVLENGVQYFQGIRKMREPNVLGKNVYYNYFLGKKNIYGQLYLIRNCSFEPSLTNSKDVVSDCLREIEIAFALNKPAIISSHRVNYIGSIDLENRNTTIANLNDLLSKILKKWPDVEFMTSDALGDLIFNDISKVQN